VQLLKPKELGGENYSVTETERGVLQCWKTMVSPFFKPKSGARQLAENSLLAVVRTRSYRWRTPRDPRKFPETLKTSTAANTTNTFRTFPETLKTISTAANTANTFRTSKYQNAGHKTNISPDCKSREITGPPQRWNLLIGCRIANADTAMISAVKERRSTLPSLVALPESF
jgi:hypothetical protein